MCFVRLNVCRCCVSLAPRGKKALLVYNWCVLGDVWPWRHVVQGAEALEYLHSQQLIHRDIKSSNFLLDGDWHCKLSDFGMAREVGKVWMVGHTSNV